MKIIFGDGFVVEVPIGYDLDSIALERISNIQVSFNLTEIYQLSQMKYPQDILEKIYRSLLRSAL